MSLGVLGLGIGSMRSRERGVAEVRTLDEAITVLDQLVSAAQRWNFADHKLFGIRLALEEAIINGVRHGNRLDPDKVVFVRYALDEDEMEVEIEDQGPGFDPHRVNDPTDDQALGIPSGRGLLLMRHYMCAVQYNPQGNCVRLCCRRSH